MHASEHDDLNWLAFRYVAGELTAEESEAFEQRLADDQQARDAVASAVQLAETVAAAEEPVTVRSRPQAERVASQRSRIVAIVSALSVLLVVGVSMRVWNARIFDANPSVARNRIATASQQERLDMLSLWNEWSQGQEFDEEQAVAESTFDRPVGVDGAASGLSADGIELAEQEFEVPDWMIAALTPELPSGPEDSDDGPVEN